MTTKFQATLKARAHSHMNLIVHTCIQTKYNWKKMMKLSELLVHTSGGPILV